jgi:aspartate/methionine/tyrosine aminotransferase
MSINFERLKPSASMEMSRISNELKKKGAKIYPLGIGDTHFQLPISIKNNFNTLNDSFSHYTNAQGIDDLLNIISNFYSGYTSKDVLIVPGLKQGLYYALEAISKKKLCILEPAWLGYEAIAIMAGYEVVVVSLYKSDWTKILEEVEFDVIICCNPNNPDGKIFNKYEINAIVNAATKNNAWIITDFIYDKYIYQEKLNETLENLFKYNNLIIGNGFSKSHAMTGFRIGYLICNNSLILQRMLVIQQNLATCVPSISQYLLLNIEDSNDEIVANSKYYFENRNQVLKIFPEWEIFKPSGGFYYFVNLAIYNIFDGDLFCQKVLRECGIVLIPGSSYGSGYESYFRLSFSIDKDILLEALQLLKKFISDEKNN